LTHKNSPKRSTKTERYDGLMTKESKTVLLDALELTGTSMNDFMVSAAVEKAEKLIKKRAAWKLNREQSITFVQSFLKEVEPNDAMKAAVLDYQNSELA